MCTCCSVDIRGMHWRAIPEYAAKLSAYVINGELYRWVFAIDNLALKTDPSGFADLRWHEQESITVAHA